MGLSDVAPLLAASTVAVQWLAVARLKRRGQRRAVLTVSALVCAPCAVAGALVCATLAEDAWGRIGWGCMLLAVLGSVVSLTDLRVGRLVKWRPRWWNRKGPTTRTGKGPTTRRRSNPTTRPSNRPARVIAADKVPELRVDSVADAENQMRMWAEAEERVLAEDAWTGLLDKAGPADIQYNVVKMTGEEFRKARETRDTP